MNGDEICAKFASLNSSITSVALIETGSLRAIYAKPGTVLPKQERFETTIAQSEFVASLFRKNEDRFGMFHYLTVHYNNSDVFLFPIVINSRNFMLVATASHPIIHEELTGKIRQLIGELRLER